MGEESQRSFSPDAVLIFADLLGRDLARRGWSRRLAGALALPEFDPASLGGAHVHLFTPARNSFARDDLHLHPQRGHGFAARLTNAIDDLAAAGYQRVVIVGRDCPQLTENDVRDAFRELDHHRLVIGPDHRGGCWLIALHVEDRALLEQIRWQRNEDAQALVEVFGPLTTHLLPVKFDLDEQEDVRHLARLCRAWQELVALLHLTASECPTGSINASWSCMIWRLQIPPPLA